MTTDISLVMLVKDPPQRVAAIAELFRPVVDEIVIAVDSTVPESSLGPLESIADEVVRVDHEPPFARTAAWLHAQARASWVLVVDGDEVPSVRLLETLANTNLRTFATHAYVGRRWLWRDEQHWLASEPWRENPALRVTPSDDRLTHWHTRLHDQVRVDGPGAHLAGDLYHLDLLVNDEATRRRKVERYDRLNPDPLPGSLVTMNRAWYLPEDRHDELHLEPVPAEDVELLRGVLAAEQQTAVAPTSPIPLVTRSDVETLVRQRPPEQIERHAELHLRDGRLTTLPGVTLRIFVGARNVGSWLWSPWNGIEGVRLGWRWYTPSHEPVDMAEGRAEIPTPIPPGVEVLLPAAVTSPTVPGEYLVGLQLVDELQAWFGELVLLPFDVVVPTGEVRAPPAQPVDATGPAALDDVAPTSRLTRRAATLDRLKAAVHPFECPVCGDRSRHLLPTGVDSLVSRELRVLGAGHRPNARCPGCGSVDQERLVLLYLRNRADLRGASLDILHFAPEPRLRDELATHPELRYVSADIEAGDVDVVLDVTDLPFARSTFDLLICNHVLEHVPDDVKAMCELHRVLRPGGRAILQVPHSNVLRHTFEDPRIEDPAERLRAFGQEDHVRIYGRDFVDRLRCAGFIPQTLSWRRARGFGGLRNRYRLIEGERLFVARK